MEQIQYPVRINKYLALKGYATRKAADELIEKKCVFINGALAVVGAKVNQGDVVEVRQKNTKAYTYYMYHKPADTAENIPYILQKQVFAVGELDKNSSGLIILTNDARLTDKLTNPDYLREFEYAAETVTKVRANFKEKMEHGVDLDGVVTRPYKVQVLNDHAFRVIAPDGRTRQLRHACSKLFAEISDLKRIRIENIRLGAMKVKTYKAITDKTLAEFLGRLGL